MEKYKNTKKNTCNLIVLQVPTEICWNGPSENILFHVKYIILNEWKGFQLF